MLQKYSTSTRHDTDDDNDGTNNLCVLATLHHNIYDRLYRLFGGRAHTQTHTHKRLLRRVVCGAVAMTVLAPRDKMIADYMRKGTIAQTQQRSSRILLLFLCCCCCWVVRVFARRDGDWRLCVHTRAREYEDYAHVFLVVCLCVC